MPRPKLRTPELRDQVLRAAVALLAEEGTGGLTARRVARHAETSLPAVYELFGDKAGLVREVCFEGFRRLGARLAAHPPTDDPRADLRTALAAFRTFVRDQPALAAVMFARPVADFDPGPDERAAADGVRRHLVGLVQRGVAAGVLAGNPTDVAHVLVAVAQGLAAQETAGWLGTSRASVNRRWSLAVDAVLDGLAP